MTKVNTILNDCAQRKEKRTLRFSLETMSFNLVSRPMQTNANEKKKVDRPLAIDTAAGLADSASGKIP